MEMRAVEKAWLPEMAALFVQQVRKLRLRIPLLPDRLEQVGTVTALLADLSERCPGVVALDRGQVIGYMLWVVVDRFRNTERKGAYCPEWGHAARDEGKPQIYRAMYRAAATQWDNAGCQVHALTLLAHDHQAQDIWFWNGFGMVVVDALRDLRPLDLVLPPEFSIRQASLADVPALGTLEREHASHYALAPTLMKAYEAQTTSALTQFLSQPENSIWLAMDQHTCAGYMRFDAHSDDSVAIVSAPDTIAITGAYVRAPYRGQRIAAALLSAALHQYRTLGISGVAWILNPSTPKPQRSGPGTFRWFAARSCVFLKSNCSCLAQVPGSPGWSPRRSQAPPSSGRGGKRHEAHGRAPASRS